MLVIQLQQLHLHIKTKDWLIPVKTWVNQLHKLKNMVNAKFHGIKHGLISQTDFCIQKYPNQCRSIKEIQRFDIQLKHYQKKLNIQFEDDFYDDNNNNIQMSNNSGLNQDQDNHDLNLSQLFPSLNVNRSQLYRMQKQANNRQYGKAMHQFSIYTQRSKKIDKKIKKTQQKHLFYGQQTVSHQKPLMSLTQRQKQIYKFPILQLPNATSNKNEKYFVQNSVFLHQISLKQAILNVQIPNQQLNQSYDQQSIIKQQYPSILSYCAETQPYKGIIFEHKIWNQQMAKLEERKKQYNKKSRVGVFDHLPQFQKLKKSSKDGSGLYEYFFPQQKKKQDYNPLMKFKQKINYLIETVSQWRKGLPSVTQTIEGTQQQGYLLKSISQTLAYVATFLSDLTGEILVWFLDGIDYMFGRAFFQNNTTRGKIEQCLADTQGYIGIFVHQISQLMGLLLTRDWRLMLKWFSRNATRLYARITSQDPSVHMARLVTACNFDKQTKIYIVKMIGDCSYSGMVLASSQYILAGTFGTVIAAALGPIIAFFIGQYIEAGFIQVTSALGKAVYQFGSKAVSATIDTFKQGFNIIKRLGGFFMQKQQNKNIKPKQLEQWENFIHEGDQYYQQQEQQQLRTSVKAQSIIRNLKMQDAKDIFFNYTGQSISSAAYKGRQYLTNMVRQIRQIDQYQFLQEQQERLYQQVQYRIQNNNWDSQARKIMNQRNLLLNQDEQFIFIQNYRDAQYEDLVSQYQEKLQYAQQDPQQYYYQVMSQLTQIADTYNNSYKQSLQLWMKQNTEKGKEWIKQNIQAAKQSIKQNSQRHLAIFLQTGLNYYELKQQQLKKWVNQQKKLGVKWTKQTYIAAKAKMQSFLNEKYIQIGNKISISLKMTKQNFLNKFNGYSKSAKETILKKKTQIQAGFKQYFQKNIALMYQNFKNQVQSRINDLVKRTNQYFMVGLQDNPTLPSVIWSRTVSAVQISYCAMYNYVAGKLNEFWDFAFGQQQAKNNMYPQQFYKQQKVRGYHTDKRVNQSKLFRDNKLELDNQRIDHNLLLSRIALQRIDYFQQQLQQYNKRRMVSYIDQDGQKIQVFEKKIQFPRRRAADRFAFQQQFKKQIKLANPQFDKLSNKQKKQVTYKHVQKKVFKNIQIYGSRISAFPINNQQKIVARENLQQIQQQRLFLQCCKSYLQSQMTTNLVQGKQKRYKSKIITLNTLIEETDLMLRSSQLGILQLLDISQIKDPIQELKDNIKTLNQQQQAFQQSAQNLKKFQYTSQKQKQQIIIEKQQELTNKFNDLLTDVKKQHQQGVKKDVIIAAIQSKIQILNNMAQSQKIINQVFDALPVVVQNQKKIQQNNSKKKSKQEKRKRKRMKKKQNQYLQRQRTLRQELIKQSGLEKKSIQQIMNKKLGQTTAKYQEEIATHKELYEKFLAKQQDIAKEQKSKYKRIIDDIQFKILKMEQQRELLIKTSQQQLTIKINQVTDDLNKKLKIKDQSIQNYLKNQKRLSQQLSELQNKYVQKQSQFNLISQQMKKNIQKQTQLQMSATYILQQRSGLEAKLAEQEQFKLAKQVQLQTKNNIIQQLRNDLQDLRKYKHLANKNQIDRIQQKSGLKHSLIDKMRQIFSEKFVIDSELSKDLQTMQQYLKKYSQSRYHYAGTAERRHQILRGDPFKKKINPRSVDEYARELYQKYITLLQEALVIQQRLQFQQRISRQALGAIAKFTSLNVDWQKQITHLYNYVRKLHKQTTKKMSNLGLNGQQQEKKLNEQQTRFVKKYQNQVSQGKQIYSILQALQLHSKWR